MGSAASMLQAARSQLGYAATSTHSKFNDWYGMNGYWCGMFVSWCAAQSGNANIIPRAAYTPTAANWFFKRGEWHRGTWGIRPGDIVYFNFHGRRIDHTGVFEGWRSGLVCTIDGNTGTAGGRSGGRVLRRLRARRWVVGYGRPAYGAASAPPAVFGNVAVDGYFGPASTRGLQHVLRTPVDGVISGQNAADRKFMQRFTSVQWGRGGSTMVRALQAMSKAGVDGYIGPDTVRHVQAMTGAAVDGYFGPNSAAALQRWVNWRLQLERNRR